METSRMIKIFEDNLVSTRIKPSTREKSNIILRKLKSKL